MELDRVDHDLDLPLVAAPGVDLGDAGTERSWGLMIQSWTVRSSASDLALARDEVVEDLAQAGRDRARAAGRSIPAGSSTAREPLVDHLAREVDVGAVLEDRRHLREAELARSSGPPSSPGSPRDGLLDRAR